MTTPSWPITSSRIPHSQWLSRRPCRALRVLSGLICVVVLSPVMAINGYFMPGYGAKSIGVAGTGVAMPQDRLTIATNPAGLTFIAPGFEAGAAMLHPQREGTLDCTGIGLCDRAVKDRSKREFFLVPSFAYSRRWGERTTLAVASYANGGMNTSYGRDFYAEATQLMAGVKPSDPSYPRRGKLGVDYAQIIIAPSAAHRFGERLSVGVAPLLMLQKFSARGLANFGALSQDASSLSNRGVDYQLGAGVRVGAIYSLRPALRLGAQYTSRVFVRRHTKYSGLFVDSGDLDAPANYTVGLSWDATSKLTLGFDFQRILYASVDTIGNRGPSAAELAGNIVASRRLGGSDGIGFGWNDLSVYKVGAIYRHNDRLTLRLGWNHCGIVVPNNEALLAPLVPAPMENDLTAGLSYKMAEGREISIGYMHSFWASTKNRRSQLNGTIAQAEGAVDAFHLGYSREF